MKKRTIISVFLVLALTLFAFPMPALAANHVRNVDTGETFSSIQAAISDGNTLTGHTIQVDAGTWTEANVDVTKAVTIESTSGDPTDTIIQASSTSDHAFDVKVNNVTIRNLSIYGATGSYKAGIYLSSATGCTIQDNRCGWDASHKNREGIYLVSSSSNTLSGNTANSNDWDGIYLYDSSSNTLSGNTANSNDYGIYLDNSSSNTLSGNTANSNGYGISLVGSSSSNTIYLNNFSNTHNVYSVSTNSWKSPTPLCYFYSPSHVNSMGNYYSDYSGVDDGTGGRTAGDGIGGTPAFLTPLMALATTIP